LIFGLLAAIIASGAVATPGVAIAAPATPTGVQITSTGLTSGQIKHVWLIMLENKSYDATFTGLNNNSYLWNTLPAQGALLTEYYGTGHYSMDNYITLASGQAPQEDIQQDCPVANTPFGTNADIVTTGANRGQLNSPANAAQPSGANAPNGQNGCTYPDQVPTLFNQLDAAGLTWKAYMQDLHNQAGREDGACGAPGSADNNPWTNPAVLTPTATHPLPTGVTSFTGAQANDQYVAKHNPTSWFASLTGDGTPGAAGLTTPAQGGTDCDVNHVVNLDDPAYGLWNDLQSSATTPAFNWITPNNCSDAHDAVCKGNNLSGAFDAAGQPVYGDGTTAPDPQSPDPTNYTGGLYAADLFLSYYIPMIEASPAFKDGGLIIVTFDEANPPFTYTGNSFNNADVYGPTQGIGADAATGIEADAAGENLGGQNVHYEPTGPNSTLGVDGNGNQLYPGPGNNAFIDRPPVCTQTEPTRIPANCVPNIVLGGSGTTPGPRTDTNSSNNKVSGGPDSDIIIDDAVIATDAGRKVIASSGPDGADPIPADSFVGAVSNTGPLFPTSNTGKVIASSFQLVDQAGNPVRPTGAVTSLTLSGEGAPGYLQADQTADPLYDAVDATPGGGRTGTVLISPLITPGTVSDVFYNHYSLLRTLEDIFQVSTGNGVNALAAGTVSGGLDGLGHLGFAAQAGLAPLGADVFTNAGTNAAGNTPTPAGPAADTGGTVQSDLPGAAALLLVVGLGLVGIIAGARKLTRG
jgi:hypothetical protein